MRIIEHPREMQEHCLHARCRGHTVGLVHEGHLSLMRWARQQADHLCVSLFVNPAQFGPSEDLESYPRDFDRDCELAAREGVDVLFAPTAESMYASSHATWVEVPELSRPLCGQSRPTHFRGVCTVVCKLLNLALPHFAVFGRKDWQQLAVVTRMARDLDLPTEIVGRPIVREPDGLAMSSRNTYLSSSEREQAAYIFAGLNAAQQRVEQGVRETSALLEGLHRFYEEHIPAGQIDYLEIVDPHELTQVSSVRGQALLAAAVYLGKARLIDNMLLEG
jgi:pantoate--beta-alanine ligase